MEKLVNVLVNQSVVADEIIIVTARTGTTKKYMHNNSVLKVFHQDGVGPANARNFGAQRTSTDFLVFLDSDCLPSDRKWLNSLLSNFDSPNVKMVSGRIIIPKTSVIQRFIRTMNGLGTPNYGTKDFYVSEKFHSFPATNLAIRKSTFDKLEGFDENLLIAEDLDFFIRAYKEEVPVKYSSEAIVYHLHRDNLVSLLKHGWKTGKGSARFFRKYGFWKHRFLRGTKISFLSVLLAPLALWLIFVSLIEFITPSLLLLLIISYLVLVIKFWKSNNFGLDAFLFPLFSALYSISLGLGVLAGTLKYIKEG